MRDEIFNMFYPLTRGPQDKLANAVKASEDSFAEILAEGAKKFDCKQTRSEKSVTWLDDSGGIEAMFFRIVDPRDINTIRGVYDEIAGNNSPLNYVFIRQLYDSEEAWDIFRLSQRSFMEHCNRISGPGSWCEDDEDRDKPRKFKVDNINISGSEFHNVNMSQAIFENVNFSGAKLVNNNMNNTKIADCDLTGMTIDEIPVTDMIKAYNNAGKSRG
jgi:hypothetical protein